MLLQESAAAVQAVDNWQKVTALATVAIALLTGVAAVAAIYYARVTAQIFRRDHRPVLRMVRAAKVERRFIIKNIGRGPAIGVVLADHTGNRVHSIDVVEPLQPGPREWLRVGRVVFDCSQELPHDSPNLYFLYYQDVAGCWHATELRPVGSRFKARFLGKQRATNIPPAVRSQAQVTESSWWSA